LENKIELGIPQTSFILSAGETAEIIARVHNRGQTIDQLTLSIEGIHPSWYTIPISSIAVFPNDRDEFKIILNPTKTAETNSGLFPFMIRVSSLDNPDNVASVNLTLEIQGPPRLELSISPFTIIGRKGLYHLTVDNKSDNDINVNLTADSAEGKLKLNLKPEKLLVPRNKKSEAVLEVNTRWTALFRRRKEYEFQVSALPAEPDRVTEEIPSVKGELLCITWYQAVTQLLLPCYRAVVRTLSKLLARPPVVVTFDARTEDQYEFKLSWSVKRAGEVRIDDEEVELQGERLVRPEQQVEYTLTARNKYGDASQTVDIQPLPTLEAKISERFAASLSPSQIQVIVGGPQVQMTLKIRNLSNIVDKFTIEIQGLDSSWYKMSSSTVALMNQTSDEIQIYFQPPKKKGTKSRIYPFAVMVLSQSIPDETIRVVGQLEVLPSVEFKLSVHPFRVNSRKKGIFVITLANTGITSADFTLGAADLEDGLRFQFKADNPTVAAWENLEVPMRVKPKYNSIIGDKKRYDITVTATTSEGNSQAERCELNFSPLIGSWRTVRRTIGAIIVLGIVIVILQSLLQLGGGWGMLRNSSKEWFQQLIYSLKHLF
jgi:uncharacterized membrane protein